MTTADIDLTALLAKFDACHEARAWAAGKTLEQAWTECPRGDWLLWVAWRLDVDRKAMVRAACACARLELPHVSADETRPIKAIKAIEAVEAVEAWTRGEATIEDVRAAREAAWDAAWASAARTAVWAACSAVWAAARAADEACSAVWAAAWAARAGGARGGTQINARSECADLVRQHIPFAEIEEKARRL